MTILKTQFEVRYTPLLNFSEIYKRIVAPYLKNCEFSLNSINNPLTETIVLLFRKENFHIDIRWDRMIFLAEGPREDLRRSDGPLFTFFDILGKFESDPSFGKINNAIVGSPFLVRNKSRIFFI